MWSGGEWPIPCHFTAWLVVATSLFVLPTAVFEAPGSLPHPPSAPLMVGGLSLSRPPRTPAGARRVAHRASLP
jgi:hypothetical protein